ncbi:MAG: Holliday junction branch migration DNA helicase RuvB [Candidatus Omnitrophica bacterium]|nr:Holliday junction branch migration DNA helicase RuvB [Candidatus Omnitrophota bacterium]
MSPDSVPGGLPQESKRPRARREAIDFERDERKKVVSAEPAEDDRILELNLRPSRLGDFTGQKTVKENLSIAIQASLKRSEPMEHVLLSGPPGLGKTTLAHIIAHEMGAKITATSGPAIERAGDLIGVLTNLNDGDILFIDEIHRLSKVVEEFIYPAMENFNIDFVIDKGPYAKTIKFTLKRFSLIGATTRSGLLSAPMRDRFGILAHLDFYEPEDLVQIVKRSAGLLSIRIDDSSAMEIARRSRGTPRIANRLLRRVRDFSQVKAGGRLDADVAAAALDGQGVDRAGLDPMDRRVLRAIMEIYNGGPVGIESLAATLNEESDTIVDVVEPYLLKAGLLKRTARGRSATRKAVDHLGRLAKDPSGQRSLF